eukprot:m.55411 g.55411  ORF g.55411 m.55411 type:complete len:350 (-) comp10983_c0_seq1:72-1121(-)
MANRRSLKEATKLARNTTPRRTRSAGDSKHSSTDILEKAEELVAAGQFDLALQFCDRAISSDKDDKLGTGALELKGYIFVEQNEIEKAVEALQGAIAKEPENGAAKYMLLGQVLNGKEAVECLEKGLAMLIEEKKTASREETVLLSSEIASGFCSVADVYLTDLCFEPSAQECCTRSVQQALQHDASNIRALHTMASICMSASEPDEANKWMNQSLALWHNKAGTPSDTMTNGPTYDVAVAGAKLLMELSRLKEAEEVLEVLLQQDDEVVEVWYLLGLANHLQGNPQSAAEYLLETKRLYAKLSCEQEGILEHTLQLLNGYPKEVIAKAEAEMAQRIKEEQGATGMDTS